jgi:large-conductance mechanosensitive channel
MNLQQTNQNLNMDMLLAWLLVTISSLDCIIVKAINKSKTETEKKEKKKTEQETKACKIFAEILRFESFSFFRSA